MNDAPDAATIALTGQLPFMIIAAAALAFPASLLLLRLYSRAVMHSTRSHVDAKSATPEAASAETVSTGPMPGSKLRLQEPGSEPTSDRPTAPLRARALQGPWRSTAVYAGAGLVFAAVMAAAFLIAGGVGFLPVRFVVLLALYAWPIVLAANLVAAITRRHRLLAVAAYFAIFALIGGIALARSSELTIGQLAVLWASTNLPPTLLLLAFLSRRIRAVGPLVLVFMMLAVTGSLVALQVAGSDQGILQAISNLGHGLGLNASATFVAIILTGFGAFGVLGWLVLGWIGRGYESKKTSDESIVLDAMWLLFGVVYSIGLAFEGLAWILSGFVAFAAYRIATHLGFRTLRADADEATPRSLLLLRVFSLGRRSERLFDAIESRWRHIGTVELISGPDLATTTVEPHEFLTFLAGKLGRLFIHSSAELSSRLAGIDRVRDGDGRYRVNDFFCRDDTWQMALAELARESDVVLMDLRGFSPRNAGCIHELNELVDLKALGQVILVVDETTDLPFLRETLQGAWQGMGPDSPNRVMQPAPLRLFQLSEIDSAQVGQLIGWLCEAAAPSPAASAPGIR